MKLKTLFIFLITFNLFSQNELKKIRIEENLSFLQPYELEEFYFKIPNIKSSNYKFYFRFNYYSQIIDLYSNDSINFEGKLLNQVIEMKSIKSNGKRNLIQNKYVYQIVDLDKKAASEIGSLILEKKLYEFPSDRSIEDWNQNWLDCGGINLQFKLENEITNSAYSCPWEQNETVEYVKVLKEFYEKAKTILGTYNLSKKFDTDLESNKCYSNGLTIFWKLKK